MKLSILIVLTLLLCGCSADNPLGTHDSVPVRAHVPVITEPERPVLEQLTSDELVEYQKLSAPLREKLEGNDAKTKTWAQQLNVAIVEYNGFSKYENGLSDQTINVKEVKRGH